MALVGLAGGFVGTLLLTLVLLPRRRSQPPGPAFLLSKVNGKPAEQNKAWGMALHWLYGIFWGLAFALGLDAWLGAGEVAAAAVAGLALLLGVVLWIVASLFWAPVLGFDLMMAEMPGRAKAKMAGGQLVAHLLYGAGLGGVLAAVPLASMAPRLGNVVPGAGLALLVLVVAAGAVTHRIHMRQRVPGRPA